MDYSDTEDCGSELGGGEFRLEFGCEGDGGSGQVLVGDRRRGDVDLEWPAIDAKCQWYQC